jgi:hypothetical protein
MTQQLSLLIAAAVLASSVAASRADTRPLAPAWWGWSGAGWGYVGPGDGRGWFANGWGMARSRPLGRADLRVEIRVWTLGSDRCRLDDGPAVLTSDSQDAERERLDQTALSTNF